MSDVKSGQMAFPITIDDSASFENFYGVQNTELVGELQQTSVADSHRVLYFYGPSGSGKSHLLYSAIKHSSLTDDPATYLSLSDSYVTPDYFEVLDVAALVCLDNIESWAGEDELERALFALFERIKHANGRLILAANNAPDQVGFKLRDLVSRISSGLIYALSSLSSDQQFDVLKMRAEQRGLMVSEEALRYLVNRVSRDTSQLFGLLAEIDRVSLVEKRKVTIPFLKSLLESR